MGNAVVLPLTAEQELVIASDNSGAIGEKPHDEVTVPNRVVGFFASRVAMMECLAAGGVPQTIVMQNFTSPEAWQDYKHGVEQVLDELALNQLPITGSTESNFALQQSGLGLTVVGTRAQAKKAGFSGEEAFAVIGVPLVGDEVINQSDKVAPLSMFQHLCSLESVKALCPAGSKGIAAAWREWTGREDKLESRIDLHKSAGPATCFLIAFDYEDEQKIWETAGSFYHRLVPITS